MIDNVSSNNTNNLNEYFSGENFRLISGAYANQSDVTSSSNTWVSSTHIITSNSGYGDALMTYDDKIVSTKYSGLVNSGNFSALANGPSGNPDYSGSNIANGHKYYYRKIQNDSNSAIRDLSYTIAGNATLKDHNSSLSSNNNDINIHFKHSGTSAWLDAATGYEYHDITTDDDGCAAIALTTASANISSSDTTNYVTFGTSSIPDDEYITVRIKASETWSGNIEKIQFTLGLTNTNTVTPSPVLSQIDTITSTDTILGVAGNLSFGSTLTKSGYTNVGSLVNSATNANGLFNVSGTRLGIFNKTQNIAGTLNNQVLASGNNYPIDSWGNGKANLGTLKIEVNGSVLDTKDLTTLGSVDSTYLNYSAAAPGKNANNVPDHRYYYRTGTFNVPSSDQRDGWNYARVIHNDGTTDHTANYIEWVNSVSNQISFTTPSINSASFLPDNSAANYLSGIQYFVDTKATITFTASNVYKHVYSDSNNAITFPTKTNANITAIEVSGSGVVNGSVNASSRSLPNLDTGVSSAYDNSITINAGFDFQGFTKSLPGSLQTAAISCRVLHPITANSTTSSSFTTPSPLMYNVSNSSTNILEDFSSEDYRLKNGTYNNQSDVSSGTWDSTQSLVGSNTEHNDGLQVYDDKLISPSNNFNNTSSMIGPQNNPNYTTATGSSGIASRTFYRYFQNTENSSIASFQIKMKGSGTNIVSSSTGSLSSSNIFVSIKLPNTSNSQSTGFLDLAEAYDETQNINQDGSGCLQGSLTSSLNTSGVYNTINIGGVFVPGANFNSGNDKNIVVKIQASKAWTGNIDEIKIIWNSSQFNIG